MRQGTHLPAYPLVTSDPYVSIWSCTDQPAREDTRHWAGQRKRLVLSASVDGASYALIGRTDAEEARVEAIEVTPRGRATPLRPAAPAFARSFARRCCWTIRI